MEVIQCMGIAVIITRMVQDRQLDTGFLGLMSIGYNNEWLGYGDAGYAGYRCVRDIE